MFFKVNKNYKNKDKFSVSSDKSHGKKNFASPLSPYEVEILMKYDCSKIMQVTDV